MHKVVKSEDRYTEEEITAMLDRIGEDRIERVDPEHREFYAAMRHAYERKLAKLKAGQKEEGSIAPNQ